MRTIKKTWFFFSLLHCFFLFSINAQENITNDTVHSLSINLTTRQIRISEIFAYQFYLKGQYNEAINEYKQILQKNPYNHKARYNLACLYARLKKYKPAIKEFKKLLKLSTPDLKRDSLYNLAVIYGKYLKDTEKATTYYLRYLKLKESTNEKKDNCRS